MTNMAESRKLSHWIKGSRQERGLSQEQLAQAGDVSVSTLQRIEYGSAPLDVDRLIQLCQALGAEVEISITDFAGRDAVQIATLSRFLSWHPIEVQAERIMEAALQGDPLLEQLIEEPDDVLARIALTLVSALRTFDRQVRARSREQGADEAPGHSTGDYEELDTWLPVEVVRSIRDHADRDGDEAESLPDWAVEAVRPLLAEPRFFAAFVDHPLRDQFFTEAGYGCRAGHTPQA